MNNKETALELLLKADGLIGQAKELLAQAVDDESECDTTNDILAAWVQAISTAPYSYLGVCGDIYTSTAGNIEWQQDLNPYGTYPTEEYALMAQKMKIFNDKLLAFKWCYDKDYQPDWENESENKYIVLFDSLENRFISVCCVSRIANLVYFSTKIRAQKCADWLNALEETED